MIAFVRVVDGRFETRDAVRAMAQGTRFEAEELGFLSPQRSPVKALEAGEVGYVVTGLKDVSKLGVGDTLTAEKRAAAEPLPGYKEVKPMVFAGLFPTDSDEYPELRDALERLKLNDGALFYEPETSQALGFGFRCGFLGLLHMEIVRERLEREFDLDLLVTAPNVAYRVQQRPDGDWIEVHNPADMPNELEAVEEPYIKASVIVPKEYVGAVMELCNERRGTFDHMEYLSEERVHLVYQLPLGEIVLDFYDQLKSRTRGYASFDYDMAGFQPGSLVRVDVLVARRAGRRALADHPPRVRLRPRQAARRAAAEGDPAPVLRRADPGRDRRPGDRPRDGEGEAQGRARQVLRRRHHPQAQAAREAEEGQEADEAGRRRRGAAGGIPRRAQPRRQAVSRTIVGRSHEIGTKASHPRDGSTRTVPEGGLRAPQWGAGPLAVEPTLEPEPTTSAARHLYVHLPFCAHRCGYCDFVTAVGRGTSTAATSTRSSPSSQLERHLLADEVGTIFLGGGTPTFTEPAALARLLAALTDGGRGDRRGEPGDNHAGACVRSCARTASIASRSARRASSRTCSRCSSGARALTTCAPPCRRCGHAGFDNLSLDLIYGIPGQSADDLGARPRRGARARARAPLLLRARGEARDALHACSRRRARQRRPTRWRATSRPSWRPSPPPVTAGTRRRTSACAGLHVATCGRTTISATGSAATTSGSGSERSRRSPVCAGGTRRASRATWPLSRAVTGRAASSSRSNRTSRRASGCCSGSASTSRSRPRA